MSNLIGNVIRLRPIESCDADILCQWKNDEDVYRYLGGGYQPVAFDQYSKWVEGMIDQTGRARRFIIESADKMPIGMIGLYEINWIHRTCEVGLFIGDRQIRRKGVGSEAYSLLEAFARDYLNLRKINLKVVTDNEQGCSFWRKMGFESAGILHEERYINGAYCDLEIMEKFL